MSQRALLGLQRAAGNNAVSRLIAHPKSVGLSGGAGLEHPAPRMQRATVTDLPELGDSALAQRLQPRPPGGTAGDNGSSARTGRPVPGSAAGKGRAGAGAGAAAAPASVPTSTVTTGAVPGPTTGTGAGAVGATQAAATTGLAPSTAMPLGSQSPPVGWSPPGPNAGSRGPAPGPRAAAPPQDAKTEISRQAPTVQAPRTADVSETSPAELIDKQGGAAVASLAQVAAQSAASAPPAAAAPKPDPLPLPDVGAAMETEAAAPAAAAMVRRDAAGRAAQQSGAQLEGMRSGASDLSGRSVQYEAPARERPESGQRRMAASEMVTGFLAAVGERAAQVTELGATQPERYSAAAATTVDLIAAAVEGQTQATSAKGAQLRAAMQAQSDSASAAVATQHAAAIAAVHASTAGARQQLATEFAGALQAIDTHQSAQLLVIEERYRAGDERFRAAGRIVGNEAAGHGDQMAGKYMRGLKDEDDSFLDGPLTYNRGKARADTAREISKAYQSGLADEANKQADQALTGKARDIESVRTTAQHAGESLQQQHAATLATIAQAETTSLGQADNARASLTAAIAQALAGGHQTLVQQEVSLTENLRAGARAQAATVEQQACELAAATQNQICSAVAGLLDLGASLEAQVQGAAPPRIEELAAALGDATDRLDSGVAAIVGQINEGSALGEQQMALAGQEVSSGLGTSTQTGLDGAAGSAADLGEVLASIAGSAAGTFGAIQQSHEGTLATSTSAATGGCNQAVTGVKQAYDEMARGLEQGFAQSAAGLEQGLRGSLEKMEGEIRTKAEENADAVPPRWKSVVKVLLIIAVIVVVALVIGPFVIGAVGAALGTGAVMTGIIAGAIVGAATSATIQVINNWASNRPLGEGVVKAAIIGGIGGAVGGGFGAYFSSAAQAGTTVVNTAFRQFMANTAINVATETVMNVVTTGHFSWEALGMSVISAVAVGGAMHAAGGIGGVKGIQEGSMSAGESVGGTIRTGLGGTVSINYRPSTTPSSQPILEPEPDVGLANRGERPAPGERSTSREDWRAEQSRLRAEQSVAGVDQPLENPNPNAAQEGHGHERHGHQTTDAEQATRVATGVAPGGDTAPAGRASRFRSPQAEAEALGRASSQLEADLQSGAVPSYTDPVTGDQVYVNPANGQPVRRSVLVTTNDPRGFGDSAQVARRVGGSSSPYVLDAAGNRIADPVVAPQMNARIVYEYVPNANEWRPVTYFPEE